MKERLDNQGQLLPTCTCTTCGKDLDAATDPTGDARPKVGDVSICVYCATLNVYDNDLRFRKPSEAELKEIQKDANIQRLISIIKAHNKDLN